MALRRTLSPLAAALGLVLALPAAGGTLPATATGGGAAQLTPAIVATRVVRAEAALARASRLADQGQTKRIPHELAAARGQAKSSWNAAAYVIETSPPTVAADAFSDGNGGAGPAYAGREDTAFTALGVYHDIVTTTVGLVTQSGAKRPALRTSWFGAIAGSQAARKRAVVSIHRVKSPGTFTAVMPGLVPLLNDEIKQIDGRLKLTGFRGTVRKSLLRARARAVSTRKLVNKYWPPPPSG